MQDLKIALISHEFPPFMIGGIAVNCYDLACSLSKRKIQTTVFCGKRGSMQVQEMNRYLKVIRLPLFNFPPRYVWFQLRNFSLFSNFCNDFSVLHGVNPLSSTFCGYYKRKFRIPFVITHHDHHLMALKVFINSPISNWAIGDIKNYVLSYAVGESLMKRSLKDADHVIVHGFYTLDHLKRLYKDLDLKETSVIYNGINFEKLDRVKEVKSTDGLSIIFYGRLVYHKGIHYLLNAMVKLKDNFSDVHLKIFGRGPLEEKIKSWVTRLGLKDKVEMQGHVRYKRLISEIKKADVVSLPSLHEVGPFIAALEGMACKKPLVVFDLPFTREFIVNMKTGILVRPGNVMDLAEKIGLLLSDKKLRNKIGKNAYEYVKKKHDWDKLVDKYIEIYKNCISR